MATFCYFSHRRGATKLRRPAQMLINLRSRPSQRRRFIKAAREAECSEDEAVFDATLKKIGSHKPGAPMAKELKTSAELNKLLLERVERSPVGRTPNPQWIKIVPADSDKEGANWRVAHSGTPGEFADAIDREMRELQTLYDLKEKSAG